MSNKIRLGDVHADVERYLREDCYCPGEIYGVDGFFCTVFGVEDSCVVIERADSMFAVVALTWLSGKEELKNPKAIVFWVDGDKVEKATMLDATENNVGMLKEIVRGGHPEGTFDEFEPGSTASALSKVLSMCDAVMIS